MDFVTKLQQILDKYNFTRDEMSILMPILIRSAFAYKIVKGDGVPIDVLLWLTPRESDSPQLLAAQLSALEIPYDNLPLHINDPNRTIKAIAIWRLKIGR